MWLWHEWLPNIGMPILSSNVKCLADQDVFKSHNRHIYIHTRGAIPASTPNGNHLFEYVLVSRQLLPSDEMEIISASTIRPMFDLPKNNSFYCTHP